MFLLHRLRHLFPVHGNSSTRSRQSCLPTLDLPCTDGGITERQHELLRLQGSMESNKKSVKQLLAELEKRNEETMNAGVGSDMSVGLTVRPSEVAQTIHEMVSKSRPRGVVDVPSPASTVPVADALVVPPAPSREEEEEKRRQEEEEQERQRREEQERINTERQRLEEQARRDEQARVDEEARAAAAAKEQQQRQAAATAVSRAAPAAPPAEEDGVRRAEGSGHEVMLQVRAALPPVVDTHSVMARMCLHSSDSFSMIRCATYALLRWCPSFVPPASHVQMTGEGSASHCLCPADFCHDLLQWTFKSFCLPATHPDDSG